MFPTGPVPPQGPVYSAYQMQQAATDAAEELGNDMRRREELAREIGRRAVYETTQIEPHPWG